MTQTAVQNLFDELNDDDDDDLEMPVLSMKKQSSIKMNQAISPMYFLLPRESFQPNASMA